jgi:hypothetical protein
MNASKSRFLPTQCISLPKDFRQPAGSPLPLLIGSFSAQFQAKDFPPHPFFMLPSMSHPLQNGFSCFGYGMSSRSFRLLNLIRLSDFLLRL